jgi:hypothetical protein
MQLKQAVKDAETSWRKFDREKRPETGRFARWDLREQVQKAIDAAAAAQGTGGS